MLSLASTMRVFVATQPIDMRKSFDGLSNAALSICAQDRYRGICSRSSIDDAR